MHTQAQEEIGQLTRVCSFFHYVSPRDLTQIVRLGVCWTLRKKLVCFLKMYLFYVYQYSIAIFTHTGGRRHQIPLQIVMSHHMVAETWTWVIWKCRQWPLTSKSSIQSRIQNFCNQKLRSVLAGPDLCRVRLNPKTQRATTQEITAAAEEARAQCMQT